MSMTRATNKKVDQSPSSLLLYLYLLLLVVTPLRATRNPTESCAGWPLPGKTTSFAGEKRWQHVGNHRLEVIVTEEHLLGSSTSAYPVRVVVPWGRHDANVSSKAVVIMSAESALVVPKCTTITATNELGDFVFSASYGPGTYHLYYMPYANGLYAENKQIISCNDKLSAWMVDSLTSVAAVPNGQLQSRTSFDSFGLMELAATSRQASELVQNFGKKDGVLLVTENKSHPLRMRRHLPRHWAARTEPNTLSIVDAVVAPGENFHFQVALYSSKHDVSIGNVKFSSGLLPLAPLCLNLQGTDYWGREYSPTDNARKISQGTVRSFYMMMKIPMNATGGTVYQGDVTLVAAAAGVGGKRQTSSSPPPPPPQYTASVRIAVNGKLPILKNGGDDQIWRNTRLTWLNSRAGLDGDNFPTPFTRVSLLEDVDRNESTVSMLGKRVMIGRNGFLTKIEVSSDSARPGIVTLPLASPIRFDVSVGGGGSGKEPTPLLSPMIFKTIVSAKPQADPFNRTVSWESVLENKQQEVRLGVRASLDFSGYIDYVVTLNASKSSPSLDRLAMSLVVPMAPESARYALGLGKKGGLLSTWFQQAEKNKTGSSGGSSSSSSSSSKNSSVVEWKWDGINGNNAVWIGNQHAGIRVFPKGASDEWQAAVPFDSLATPPIPEEWSNNGTGGIRVSSSSSAAADIATDIATTVTVFTGERELAYASSSSSSLVFRFSLMITPTRPLNLTKHWSERHYQADGPTNYTAVAEGGATILVEHQGNVVNPWINYPYLTNHLMRQASNASHAVGMKFKIYNTMRELSYKAREIWAMRSLDETYVSGPDPQSDGTGSPWLQEHLGGNYQVAWSNNMEQPIDQGSDMWWSQQEDHAIKVNALSRWNNYYVQGNMQMQKDFQFDGIYLDEIAYDRVTMLRTKAILSHGLIDHHCDLGAFCHSCASNYMELYPFIDSLWYGEGFDYDNATPDYWLAEISGLLLGLTSEMLRYPGMTPMHFRGLAHGMTNRWQHSYKTWEKSTECVVEFAVSPGCDPFDPRDIWALQREFEIERSNMIGWWEDVLAVTSNVENVKVTTYVRSGKSALIVLANFGKEVEEVTLEFDWELLGFKDGSGVIVRVPGLRVPVQLARASVAVKDGVSIPLKVPALRTGAIDSCEGVILMLEKF